MHTILFDLDGTLVNSEWLAKEAYNHGIETVLKRKLTNEERESLVGKPIAVFLRRFPNEAEQIRSSILQYFENKIHQIRPYPGVISLLESLSERGYGLGIVTSQLKKFAYGELINNKLDGFFKVVLTAEDCDEYKPSPKPLLTAVNHLHADVSDCLYIGDQMTDIEAAHAADMKSAGALWGEGNLTHLSAASPTYFVKEPQQLLRILQDNNYSAAF
ncbi:phosphoglycolate phosphatase [Bacillus velezensis]|uniref:HAD family hydrolase n=1 Tax=Bacillus velezensis TaxID=492670 RepID=UPI00100BCB35|nr:HAD family hydrolase [Bacillus velezensis]MEC3796624.1 HAD family hydrolase [Bacillus velezensis]RXK26359.1 phosphoglycolate phosphatase [Bacillus velezensis]